MVGKAAGEVRLVLGRMWGAIHSGCSYFNKPKSCQLQVVPIDGTTAA